MKVQVTKRMIKENYTNIIEVSYCELQHLLRYEDARFYTAGIYGWSADIYEIDRNTVIVTGYSPFGNIRPDYKMVRKYDEKAREIHYDYDKTYEQNRKRLSKLLEKFIKEVVKE